MKEVKMGKVKKNSAELKGGLSGNGTTVANALQEAATKVAAKKPPELKIPSAVRTDMSALDLLDMEIQEVKKEDAKKRINKLMDVLKSSNENFCFWTKSPTSRKSLATRF